MPISAEGDASASEDLRGVSGGDRYKSRGQLLRELATARLRISELEGSAPTPRAEVELHEREAELRAIVESLPDLVIRIHKDGTILDIKSPSPEVLTRPPEELVGCNIRETDLPEEVIAIHCWNIEAAFRMRRVQTFVYPLAVMGGDRDFEGRAVACTDDEVLLVIRDITEAKRTGERLKRLEAQLHQARRSESIGRLAAGVAHNLNNLLAPIIAYAEMLRSGMVEVESSASHLQAISEAAAGASELTQQLLAVGSEQPHERRRVDLGLIVEEYERILRSAIHKGIKLRIRCPKDPVVIEADSFQIQQILLNLALNAQDAIEDKGTIEIEVRGVFLEDEEHHLPAGNYGAIRVRDDGSGIEPKIREEIFDPFFSTKETGKGTGLGLASVRGIVQQHGGGIHLESAIGEGSTFDIFFPLHERAKNLEKGIVEASARDRRRTVLVVEDEETVRHLVGRILRDNGYLVMTAAGGDECLDLVASSSKPVDLLLTDLVMPGLDGRQLYERLRGELPDLKVLYMSGFGREVTREYGVARDSPMVQKPFSIPRLLHDVEEALSTA